MKQILKSNANGLRRSGEGKGNQHVWTHLDYTMKLWGLRDSKELLTLPTRSPLFQACCSCSLLSPFRSFSCLLVKLPESRWH